MNKWNYLPNVLKHRPQWCIAGADKRPKYVENGVLKDAKVNDPATWMPFDVACGHAQSRSMNIGYVLSADDPFSCIDLDVKDAENCPHNPERWTDQSKYDLFYRIMQNFNSYTETSASGKGLHIWVMGNIGEGVRRDDVEIYSQLRFIVCTGNVVTNSPIMNREEMLRNMADQMRGMSKKVIQLEELPQVDDDWYILLTAVEAANSEKFCALWQGDWPGLGFPSQSEADVALMSMLTFYSPSNEQCRRLFRMSRLGQREKAVKNDVYLNRTLSMIRGREAAEQAADLAAIEASADEVSRIRLLAKGAIEKIQGVKDSGRFSQPLHIAGQETNVVMPPPAPVAAAAAAPVRADVLAAGKEGLAWPPGFAGKIAQYIYQTAPRPVKEVAIVAALGLLAGICGKAWNIPQSGLNMYIILVAKSAIGKEAMHSGLASLVSACSKKMPTFQQFVDFTDYASGPALMKAVAANTSFVNVSGEWGRKLKRMSEDSKDGALATLRTQMTNLYQKSGPQSIVGGIGYSNKDNNIASISGVAYSMIGETTPTTFYESLTPSMMEDGFLSRFLIIEYTGLRPPMNQQSVLAPDPALEDGLVKMAFQAMNLVGQHTCQPISRTEEVAEVINAFEIECDKQINRTDDESQRQMWNRAALKSLRVAGLLAVADNWVTPVIQMEHIQWAIEVVRRDIATMAQKLVEGDVGMSDDSRERKVIAVIMDYLTKEVSASYRVPEQMQADGVIPRKYISQRVSRSTSFVKYPRGAAAAVDATLKSLVDNGYIVECKSLDITKKYGVYGKCYRILHTPDYLNL